MMFEKSFYGKDLPVYQHPVFFSHLYHPQIVVCFFEDRCDCRAMVLGFWMKMQHVLFSRFYAYGIRFCNG